MPSRRAAASLSPPDSRRARRIARRLEFFERQQFVALRHAVARAVLKIRGQIADVKDGPGAEGYGAFDGVFEFADVAGPVVGNQAGHGVFGNRAHGALRFAEFLEERIDQQAECRFLRSRKGGSLICTTFRRKKRSWRNWPWRTAASRSRLVAAMMRVEMETRSVEPTGLTSFSCSARRSLACKSTGQVADFVEEKRAAAGRFHEPLLGLHRSGKGALHVSEQLGFDQRGNQRGAVHGNEWLVASRARKMNGAGHQLLARSALAQNQHGIVVLADLFDQAVNALHLGREADQSAETRASAQLFAQHAVFLIDFKRADHTVQLAAQFGNVKRLRDVIGGARCAWPRRRFRSCRTA